MAGRDGFRVSGGSGTRLRKSINASASTDRRQRDLGERPRWMRPLGAGAGALPSLGMELAFLLLYSFFHRDGHGPASGTGTTMTEKG